MSAYSLDVDAADDVEAVAQQVKAEHPVCGISRFAQSSIAAWSISESFFVPKKWIKGVK